MHELNNRISGDWVDITKSALKISELVDYFNLDGEKLNRHVTGLKFAVESGIAEYKTSLLNPLFTTLEEMKFKSLSFDELREKNNDLNIIIFLVLLQRLFASGSLGFSFTKEENPAARNQNDINLIIADVLARIKENKELLPLYTKQAREFARIRSILSFALEDKYKTREVIVNAAGQKELCLKLIDQEIAAYKKLCTALDVPKPGEYALRVSLALAVEVGLILEKIIQKEEAEPEAEE
ncbi:MAG: hypothetical protein P8107_15475 [Spirochaetia bacterium]